MNKYLRTAIYVLCDIIVVACAYVIATLLTSGDILGAVIVQNKWWLIGGLALAVALNVLFKLYGGMWKYAGLTELLMFILAGVVFLAYNILMVKLDSLDIIGMGWAFMASVGAYAVIMATRFAIKLRQAYIRLRQKGAVDNNTKKVMIIGAGYTGELLVRDMFSGKKGNLFPVCLIDDDKSKIGMNLHGVKVVGDTTKIEYFAKKFGVDLIIIAIPSIGKADMQRVLEQCRKAPCKTKTVSSLVSIMEGQASASDIKEVSIEELLGREQVKVNLNEITTYIKDKVVLVTGGGGSIGSELCRQISKQKPKQLIIVDIYENNAYDIQQELLRKYPSLNLLVLIASVRDSKKVNDIFKKYKPEIVFHAAAHKHVPLMETSPNEAVKNNVSGTLKVADAAGRNGAKRFILISTDKAVNPTNIMGATKRICEMIIQAMDKKYATDYVAVRFGNVLGSNGSVIPLFRKQIEEGGPVTVTHKDIVRYFMTIPEAVSLVLQAGAYAKGGEIFVLDMGEPVKIYDLAVNIIKLSGLTPGKDIEIKITGLRPGEKLYEERLMEEEGLQKTANEMISIGKPIEFDETVLFEKLQELYVEAYNETEKMKELVHELVPTYKIDKRD